ncbi:hypothetical protein FHL15_011348 [Xylaria flabelliformis]|uniref:Zn(2)-C6 fungal-type domain-containing protein n=1 Tax=Xylaria flabelliformis TaxID=2512241 RepID=A0A553HII4_9PEZI|nr:hypothetical protein FHL15_011348 [Xylaria flabelliformis]
MTKVKKGKRQRAYRPKTQTGCLTCKIRRVKCDEALPACLRCTSTGRTCDGYAHINTPTEAVTILAGPSFEIQVNSRSKRSFAFFVQRTCLQLAGFFGSDFWERLILQAAHHEPAIRHAIIAIGSRHELAVQQTANIDTVGVFALGQYNLAIKHLLDPSITTGKRSIDNMQGNNSLAINHIQSGVKLLRETAYDPHTRTLRHQHFGSTGRINSYASLETYAKIFALLDSQASKMIGDYQRPLVAASHLLASQIYGDAPLSFSSINEAKSTFEFGACLFSGNLDAKLSDDAVQFPHKSTEDRSHLANLMAKFWLAVQELMQSKRTRLTQKEELAAAVLQLNVLVTWISFEVELRYPNSLANWDDFMDQVLEMVTLGEKIVSLINESGDNTVSFGWESGYIIPVYAVATNCRDHTIRHRAIAILQSVHRQEGLWNSLLVARAAKRIMEIEETKLIKVDAPADGLEAPEWLSSRPLLKIDGRGGHLHYIRNTREEHSPQEVIEEVFSW